MSTLIRLEYATSSDVDIDGMYGNISTIVRAKVKNIAYAKIVLAYNNDGGSSVWQNFPMTWIANFGNYDLFGLDISGDFLTGELAVSCTEAGITDWDNNGSANYPLIVDGSIVGGNVALNQAVAQQGTEGGTQTSWIEGVILVNNLSYGKQVGIRYTTNNWATWTDSAATHVGPFQAQTSVASPGTGEQWNFTTPEMSYDNASASFQFAVYYQRLDTGEWFWDNNFSQNYTLSKAAGTTIQ